MTAFDMMKKLRENLNKTYEKGFDMTRAYIEFSAWHMFKQEYNMTEKLAYRMARRLEREYPKRGGHRTLHPTKQNLLAIINGDLGKACV